MRQSKSSWVCVRSAFALAGISLGLATITSGCSQSDGLPREAISGSVLYDNKPIPSGLITFLPDDSNATTQGGAPIEDGKFTIPKIAGLVPGKYKVIVTAGDSAAEKKVDKDEMPGMPPLPAKEGIPSDYNTKSVLTAEVTQGGKNDFNFSLSRVPQGK